MTDNARNAFCLRGGDLDIDATWDITNTSYFLLDHVTIAIGSTLTIDPAVIVKFSSQKSIFVNGALRAVGTASDPIIFTSYRDDTTSDGDANGDGSSIGYRGDWRRIEFTDTSDDTVSIIDHAIVRFGGYDYGSTEYGAVTLIDASPTIQHTEILENVFAGILAQSSAPQMICNNIYNNQAYGIYNSTPETSFYAIYHWWGSDSGPYHSTTNPTGTGNAVTDGIRFIPWLNFPCGPSTTFVYLPLITK